MEYSRELDWLTDQVLGEHYGIVSAQIQPVSQHSFNTVFRVDTKSGRSVLRVGTAERIHPEGTEDVEAGWLNALAGHGLCPLRNLATMTGDRWVRATHPAVAEDRIVTRFTWVDGTELRSQIDARSAAAAGRLLAQLHAHAAETEPVEVVPESLHARFAVYFGSHNLVADYESRHGGLFTDAIDRVQHYVDSLWADTDTPHLLHGDFGPHNILIHEGQLQPIDFQDLRYGFAVQDLGISVSDMDRVTPELVAPFLSGYGEIRTLPDLSPEVRTTMAAARSLNIMNLALLAPESNFGTTLARHADRVVTWMTGSAMPG